MCRASVRGFLGEEHGLGKADRALQSDFSSNVRLKCWNELAENSLSGIRGICMATSRAKQFRALMTEIIDWYLAICAALNSSKLPGGRVMAR